MKKRLRREFISKLKADAVGILQAGHHRIAQDVADLDLIENSLRKWAQRAGIDVYSKVQSGLLAVVRLRCKPLRMRMLQQ